MMFLYRKLNAFVVVLLLVVALFALLQSAARAEEGEATSGAFFQWEDRRGTLSFSNSLKNIPPEYRDNVVRRTFAEVRANVAPRETRVDASTLKIHVPRAYSQTGSEPLLAPRRSEREDCNQPLTIESRRVQQGRYNRLMYVVIDECGEEISVTPQTPWVDVSVGSD